MLIDPKKQPDKNIRDRFFELFGRPDKGKKNHNAFPPKTAVIPYSSFMQSLVDGYVFRDGCPHGEMPERLIQQHGKLRMLFDMSDFHGWVKCEAESAIVIK
ncbi:MAG: hypothetical protein PF503_18465 [Desulfobacula sp.]|jgi:hypothetical protein|nr:hypothetical protein [Desulfobacula sp.]